jgi:hypothetical protein
MDIAVTVITVAVVLFFAAVILSNVPWGRILGRRKQEEKVELARQIYFYFRKTYLCRCHSSRSVQFLLLQSNRNVIEAVQLFFQPVSPGIERYFLPFLWSITVTM